MKTKTIDMNKKRFIVALILIGVTGIFSVGCGKLKPELTEINLPMGYVANVQFSPFYVAKERGYFESAGFEVNFDYRWETDGIQLVATGEIPFTVASGDQVIQARTRGFPVKAIAAWYQNFPVAIISLSDVPLNSPQDLANLRIGIPETFGASYIGLRALLKAGNLTEQDIDLQAIGYTQLALLTTEKIDAAVVYANNEPVLLANEGYAYNILYVSDYADLVSAVLVSSDTFIKENPAAVKSFVGAFLHGLSDTIEDPDMAFDTSLNFVEGLSENAETQRGVLQASLNIWQTPQPGLLTQDSWEFAQEIMLQADLIDSLLPASDYYTNEFIP